MTHIATLAFGLGILGLFLLDRDRTGHTSKALWLPVGWLLIAGSRPVSGWLQLGQPATANQYLEGSPIDRAIYTALLAVGIAVLVFRQSVVLRFLRANGPVLLFVLYCAVSVSWSDYPDIAFKRWIKSLGDYVMVMIVLTDPEPLRALKRVLARAGFLLLPISVLFIKYYPDLGRSYAAHWEGTAYFVGVAQDKNMLGMTCLVFGLASAWRFFQELQKDDQSNGRGPLIAHGAILVMTLWLFWMSKSMTSLACFILASGLIAANAFLRVGRNRNVVHLMVAVVLAFCFCVLFLNIGGFLLSAMGRDPTLTGRTELWQRLLGMTVNPLVGAGFESFWLGQRVQKLWSIYWWHPNESHNGYLEVFLNLGWVGVALFAVVAVAGYRNVVSLLNRDPRVGRLRLAYFVAAMAYNLTEAAIRTTDLVWIAFLFAIIAVPKAAIPDTPKAKTFRSRALVARVPVEEAQEVV